MADTRGNSNGVSQEAPNGTTTPESSPPKIVASPTKHQASDVGNAGLKETVSDDSVAAQSPTTYRRSSSQGSLHNAVEMPFLEVPPNSPVSNESDENDLVYKEPQDNVTNTINRILDTYSPRDETDNESPFRDPPKPHLKTRREGTSQGSGVSQSNSAAVSPLNLQRSPPSAGRGHRRSKSIREFSFGCSDQTPTASSIQRMFNADSQAVINEVTEDDIELREPSDFYEASASDDVFSTSKGDSLQLSRRQSAAIQPGRGRDVSFAMRHVGRVNEASQATLVTQDDESPSYGRGRGTRLPSTSAYADLRSQREVGNDQNAQSPSKDEKLALRDSANTDDWCTTAMNSEAGFLSGASMAHPNIIKTTGSSIVGNSEGSGWNISTGGFRSRPRLIQHPSVKGRQESYQMRTVKDPKWPMLLPKSHFSTGGYPENSSRSMVGENNYQLSSPIRNPSGTNPFLRVDSDRHNAVPGSLTLPLTHPGQSRYEFRDSASTFALSHQGSNVRLSTVVTEGGNGLPEKSPTGNLSVVKSESGNTSVEQSSSKVVECSPHKPYEPRHVDLDYPHRHIGSRKISKAPEDENWAIVQPTISNAHLMSSRSKFEFSLIPLEEAQRKNKKQRESGETDETESSMERCQRSEHAKSVRTIPSTPARIAQPIRSQARDIEAAPKLSIDFSPSSVFYADALRDITPNFSATTHPDLAQPKKARIREPAVVDEAILPYPQERSWLERAKSLKTRAIVKKNEVQRKISHMTTSHRSGTDNDSQLSLATIEDMTEPHLSYGARARRRRIFILAAILSALFPFIAILVMARILDPVVQWYTSGEVQRLTIRQHNVIRSLFFTWLCAIMIAVPTIIAVFVKRS
ncbi:hypothetical protein F4805DRAFT_459329 [Annulohypoxylon moriforme]|nr:hypothetical protein F4805DRAFT_459329 [Annulohypoxylon moriforme]